MVGTVFSTQLGVTAALALAVFGTARFVSLGPSPRILRVVLIYGSRQEKKNHLQSDCRAADVALTAVAHGVAQVGAQLRKGSRSKLYVQYDRGEVFYELAKCGACVGQGTCRVGADGCAGYSDNPRRHLPTGWLRLAMAGRRFLRKLTKGRVRLWQDRGTR